MQGVTEDTLKVLEVIKDYKELEQYFLIGGTALAIKLGHRLSEDLDLFTYRKFPGSRFNLPNLDEIFTKFKSDFSDIKTGHYEKTDVTIYLDGIKVQLRAENQFHGPKKVDSIGHIGLPNETELLGMKLVALSLRNTWRDIFDLTHLVDKFDYEDFPKAYNSIMSSKYTGSKNGKKKLYNATISKLKDENFLEKLYRNDPMEGLITNREITPKIVLEKFAALTYIEVKD